jgi:hypothetical protein
MVVELSASERDYLLGQRLGRLASIDAHGQRLAAALPVLLPRSHPHPSNQDRSKGTVRKLRLVSRPQFSLLDQDALALDLNTFRS